MMFWLSLILLVAAGAALVTYVFGTAGPPEKFTIKALLVLAAIDATLAGGAVWLFHADKLGWGSLLLLIAFVFLFSEIADWGFPTLRRRFVVFWLPISMALSFASWAVYEPPTPREKEAFLPETQAPSPTFADLLARSRTHWETGGGVAEGTAGPLIGWLAIEPMIEVDWIYEQDHRATARRSIPLRVVLLNNSFTDAEVAAAADTALWQVTITAVPSGEVIRTWDAPENAARRAFSPTERRDFRILWDGRNRAGDLVAPGPYVAQLTVASVNAEPAAIEIDVEFTIEDAGPIVVVKEDPQTAIIRQMEQNLKASQILDAGLREMERQRQFQFQFPPRFP